MAVNESSDEEDFIESDEEDEEGTTSHGDAEKGQKRYGDCFCDIFGFPGVNLVKLLLVMSISMRNHS